VKPVQVIETGNFLACFGILNAWGTSRFGRLNAKVSLRSFTAGPGIALAPRQIVVRRGSVRRRNERKAILASKPLAPRVVDLKRYKAPFDQLAERLTVRSVVPAVH
jgi:hypothetical protein